MIDTKNETLVLPIKDSLFILRMLATASGMLDILRIQRDPLSDSQKATITRFLFQLDTAMDKVFPGSRE